jgi:hypothetical protein
VRIKILTTEFLDDRESRIDIGIAVKPDNVYQVA